MKLLAIIANWFKRPAPTTLPPGYLIEQNQNGQFRWFLPELKSSRFCDRHGRPRMLLDDAIRDAWDDWHDSRRIIKTNTWSRVL